MKLTQPTKSSKEWEKRHAAHVAQMTGWGTDERGLVRCPDCLAGGAETAPPPPSQSPEPDLFGEAA